MLTRRGSKLRIGWWWLGLLLWLSGSSTAWAEESRQAMVERVLALTNEARAQVGAPPLQLAPYLEGAAQAHSEEMLELDYFSHQSPTPERHDARSRVSLAGGWDSLIGENIYRGEFSDPEDVAGRAVANWLRSPSHYRVLTNPEFNRLGVGIAQRGGRFLLTQNFSRQTIEVLEATRQDGPQGPELCLRGRVLQSQREGGLFHNQQLLTTFKTDEHGEFFLRAPLPQDGTLEVSLRKGATRYATQLRIPIADLPPRQP